jgi:hypothetical protein
MTAENVESHPFGSARQGQNKNIENNPMQSKNRPRLEVSYYLQWQEKKTAREEKALT